MTSEKGSTGAAEAGDAARLGSPKSLRVRLLLGVARLTIRHAAAVLVLAATLTAASTAVIAWYGAAAVSTDVMDIIPPGSRAGRLYRELARDFAPGLYVAVESEDPADIEAAGPFVELFARKLASIRAAEPEVAAAAAILEGMTGRSASGEAVERRRPDAAGTAQLLGLIARAAKDAAREGDSKAEQAAGELAALLGRAAEGRTLDEAAASRAWGLFRQALDPGGVRSVSYGGGEGIRDFMRAAVAERGYLFLDAEDRARIAERLDPAGIDVQMARNRERYLAAGADYLDKIARDPLNLGEVLRANRARPDGVRLGARAGEGFLVSPDGTLMLMIVRAARPHGDIAFDRAFLRAVRAAEQETWDELEARDAATWGRLRGRLEVRYAGSCAASVAENAVFTGDVRRTFPVSLLGVVLLFVVVFRRPGTVVYVGVPLGASILWTVAAAFLALGRISGMSSGFAAILAGLSVDHAIHIYSSFAVERRRGLGVEEAIRRSIVNAGNGVFFGALTTAVAFFGCVWTRFPVLRELALTTGTGVLLGLAAMLFVLPAMLVVRNRIGAGPRRDAHVSGFGLASLARLTGRAPWALFAASAAGVVAAAVFSLACVDEGFFDHDFMRTASRNPAIELYERIERKFGASLGASYVLSRGGTVQEALGKASLVSALADGAREGVPIAGSGAGYDESAPLRPWIAVDGCAARVERVEMPFPAGVGVRGLAEGAEVLTRADGSRLVVYGFGSESEMRDWETEGEGRFRDSMELAEGSRACWRHRTRGAVEVRFSVRVRDRPSAVHLGLGEGLCLGAVVSGTPRDPGSPWPPSPADQVSLVLRGDPDAGLALFAGRGTVSGSESLTRYVPPLCRQEESARFVAGIDVESLREKVGEAGLRHGFRPELFTEFFEGAPSSGDGPETPGLCALVEGARSPAFLTVEELERSGLGEFVSQFYRLDPEAEEERRHVVATRLVLEGGEHPEGWYGRVRAAFAPGGEFVSSAMVSYEMRSIVYEDMGRIMVVVLAGVAASLLWSFGSLRWSLVALVPVTSGLVMLAATLLAASCPLNYVNILVLPVIVGVGIDDGIHVVHRLRRSGTVAEVITETGPALVTTSLTTMIGFGALMISRYRGLASLGLVAALGMFYCLCTSLVMLPALLAGLEKRRRGVAAHEGAPSR